MTPTDHEEIAAIIRARHTTDAEPFAGVAARSGVVLDTQPGI